MKLVWTPEADEDLDHIVRYIARGNVDAALRVQDRIEAAVEQLRDTPRMGRSGVIEGTRELVVTRTPYLVVYGLDEQQVLVLRVLHGAQRWPPDDDL